MIIEVFKFDNVTPQLFSSMYNALFVWDSAYEIRVSLKTRTNYKQPVPDTMNQLDKLFLELVLEYIRKNWVMNSIQAVVQRNGWRMYVLNEELKRELHDTISLLNEVNRIAYIDKEWVFGKEDILATRLCFLYPSEHRLHELSKLSEEDLEYSYSNAIKTLLLKMSC